MPTMNRPNIYFVMFCKLSLDSSLVCVAGCLNFKNLFLANPTETLLEQAVAAGSDDAVIYQPISKGGAGAPTAAGKVVDLPSWSFAKRMISHEYFETA